MLLKLRSDSRHFFSLLIENDFLPANQASLECLGDLDRANRTLQTDRHWYIIETKRRELECFSDESLSESLVVVLWQLAPCTMRVMDLDMIFPSLHVHSEGPTFAYDFRRILLARCHHARAVQGGDLAAIEFECGYSIVPVIHSVEFRVYSSHPHCLNALKLALLAEEPEHEVDVMNRAVNEDTSTRLSVTDEVTRGVVKVGGL